MPEDVTDRRCCHKCQMTVTGKRKLSKCARCHSITYCGKECQRKDWPRHSQFCIPVMVTEIPGKGKGLVASKHFKKGEVLFQETAGIFLHTPSYMVPLKELKEQISKLSVEQKTRFYQLVPKGKIHQAELAPAFRENCILELDIFVSNRLVCEDKSRLYLSTSLINHSCAPNVLYDPTDDLGNEVKVRAIKDISKGEEVTECYIGGFNTMSQMKTKLREVFNFDCKCGVCSGSIPNQDRLILEISSTLAYVESQSLDFVYYQKKKNEWTTEVLQLERTADLTKQLYIGHRHIMDRFKVFLHLIVSSQMARDSIRLKKATDFYKEELISLGLMELQLGKGYKNLERKLERWSSAFQSKRNPTKEEIDDFYG